MFFCQIITSLIVSLAKNELFLKCNCLRRGISLQMNKYSFIIVLYIRRGRNKKMIQLIKDTIEDIPVLHVVQEGMHQQALPTVIYYHGYNGEKISSLTLAYMMAEK